MRPHQECLLLASGFDRSPSDAPRQHSQAQAQLAQLRDFVRAMLGRKSPAGAALRDIDLFGACGGLAILARRSDGGRAVSPVDPAQAMVAFDLPALLHAPHLRKYAVLPPLALARDMALIHAGVDPMPVLATLQDVLRHCHAVTVFGAAAACDLALLGAGRIAVLPLPALTRQAGDTGQVIIRLFDHAPTGGAATVAGAVAEALPGAMVLAADAAPAMAPGFGLHLHLGPGETVSPAAPWRIVDSFAARCPVVHLTDGRSRAEPAEHGDVAVEPMRTGILAGSVSEAVAGLVRLAADAALVDVFRRHAAHAAEAFNRRIEDRLREVSP